MGINLRRLRGALLLGVLLGSWVATPEAQGPFSAQIIRALRAYGLVSPGVFQGSSSTLTSTGCYGWSSTSLASGTADLFLCRDAANTAAFRNSTNAQTVRVYRTFTDTGNYGRFAIQFSGSDTRIGTEGAGAGAPGDLFLGAAATYGWRIKASDGSLVAATDNTYDFGASGATRARTIYAATSMVSPFYNSSTSTVLSVTANVIAPTTTIHHVGAGLIKTITVPTGCTPTCAVHIVPDAAYTYDATGNVVVPAGGGTAVVNRLMTFVWDGSKWTPSY